MPFKSEKQRKWMHANEPEMAKKWEKEESEKNEMKNVESKLREFIHEFLIDEGFTVGSNIDSKMTSTRSQQVGYNQVNDLPKPTFDISKTEERGDGEFPSGNLQESVWSLPKGSTTQDVDELDADLSRAGLKSKPDFTKLLIQVVGNKSKINKIMKFHRAKKIFEGKIKEDYKNSEWEVYLKDEKGREKIVKVAKSKRAATILYNRIIKSDDYYEVGMRAIKEGKLKEDLPIKKTDKYTKTKYKSGSEAEDDFKKHHAGSLGAGDMGYLAEPDTYDWDDKEKDKEGEEGGHQIDKDTDDRGYEPVKEAKKRDYKAEYKKFQSSKKMKKYRAELNKYNRQKGTYGNGDKKDASHKGGKIAGFEEQSKNRGRREKSRLKKEGKLTEASGVDVAKKVLKNKQHEKGLDMQTANLIMTIHKAYNKNKELQRKFEKIPLNRMKELILRYMS